MMQEKYTPNRPTTHDFGKIRYECVLVCRALSQSGVGSHGRFTLSLGFLSIDYLPCSNPSGPSSLTDEFGQGMESPPLTAGLSCRRVWPCSLKQRAERRFQNGSSIDYFTFWNHPATMCGDHLPVKPSWFSFSLQSPVSHRRSIPSLELRTENSSISARLTLNVFLPGFLDEDRRCITSNLRHTSRPSLAEIGREWMREIFTQRGPELSSEYGLGVRSRESVFNVSAGGARKSQNSLSE